MSYSKRIYLLLGLMFLAACAPQSNQPPVTNTQAPIPTQPPAATSAAPNLAGTDWVLVSYGQPGAETQAVAGGKTTLHFGADGKVSGSAGCNSYGGGYQVKGDTISFDQVISTMMACADPNLMNQEQVFLQALNSSAKVTVTGSSLAISYNNGQGVLNFSPGPAAPQETSTSAPSATAISPTTPVSTGYLDDRSTPAGLIQSYFNAVNRKEYLRAYSYWRDPASEIGSFDKFAQGYQDTISVDVTLGPVGADPGAGQLYYSVPAILRAQTSGGGLQTYTACYLLHLSQPIIQAVPPYNPLGIEKATSKAAANGASDADLLPGACQDPDFAMSVPPNPVPVTNTSDISKDNYLDNRSGPVEVLSSLFNAVNRKEYARAYSYWENAGASSQVPPFDQFQQGYADTETVQLTTGLVTSGAAAGNRYYSVPVLLQAQTTAGASQTFVGCYQLHLGDPSIQATPPFQPMAVQSATVKQVASGANASALLDQACAK